MSCGVLGLRACVVGVLNRLREGLVLYTHDSSFRCPSVHLSVVPAAAVLVLLRLLSVSAVLLFAKFTVSSVVTMLLLMLDLVVGVAVMTFLWVGSDVVAVRSSSAGLPVNMSLSLSRRWSVSPPFMFGIAVTTLVLLVVIMFVSRVGANADSMESVSPGFMLETVYRWLNSECLLCAEKLKSATELLCMTRCVSSAMLGAFILGSELVAMVEMFSLQFMLFMLSIIRSVASLMSAFASRMTTCLSLRYALLRWRVLSVLP